MSQITSVAAIFFRAASSPVRAPWRAACGKTPVRNLARTLSHKNVLPFDQSKKRRMRLFAMSRAWALALLAAGPLDALAQSAEALQAAAQSVVSVETPAAAAMEPSGSAEKLMWTIPGPLNSARGAGQDAVQTVQRDGVAPSEPDESSLERIQIEADYTKEAAVYRNQFLDYAALYLGLALVLIWLFGSDLALRLRGDILPFRIKARLDRFEVQRLAISASLRSLASAEPDHDWPEERQAYESVATSANALLETAKQGLKFDSIDVGSLILELDRILSHAESLAMRLQTLAPTLVSAEERIDVPGLSGVERISRGWERVFASGKASKLTTLGQLNAMRWPNWPRLATPPR